MFARFGSYGKTPHQHVVRIVALAWLGALAIGGAAAADRPLKIVALGDSLTAGFQLAAADAFPAKLEQALRRRGHAVEIINAGVSGDPASAGLARLAWSVPKDADAVILELGANDALRGVDPKLTRQALEEIVRTLRARGVEVLLAGMRAPPNLGADYARAFDAIFPELALTYHLVFYPFFLEGVAADSRLNQRDGLHPTAAGIDVIVMRILPKVEELIARVRAK